MPIVKQVPDKPADEVRQGERVLLYLAADDETEAIREAEDWCRQHGFRRTREYHLPVRLLGDGAARAYQATCYRPYDEELEMERQDHEAFRRQRDRMQMTVATTDLLHRR